MKIKVVLGLTGTQFTILFAMASMCGLLICIGIIIILNNLGYFSKPILFWQELSSSETTKQSTYTPTSQKPTLTPSDSILIGKWDDNWVGHCIISIWKVKGAYYMEQLFDDGGIWKLNLAPEYVDGDLHLKIDDPANLSGDYVMILPNGHLVFYDNEGYIYEDLPIK
jgi:hypothetical protein